MTETTSETIAPGSIAPGSIERHGFGAEVGRLLDLVVHSLYSDREIFLRELVANAADAIDRRRFEGLSNTALTPPEGACVRISVQKEARTITIEDDGIGMTREDLIANLGTIARSGTRAFGEKLATANPEDRPSLIGQFGVGFYSAFMVAERVDVVSRPAGEEAAWKWSSEGAGEFTLAPAERDRAGSTITLYVRENSDDFLEEYRLETIIKKWSDHIDVPVMIVRDGKDVAANAGTALWRKAKSAVTEEEYKEFWRHLGNYFDEPWATLHWRAEGTVDFAALLFIPGAKPFMPVEEQRESRLRLHVKRMFITDQANLLPAWLRFVQGVVDTEDLPLNVSREMLQSTPVLARIRRALINRVLGELKNRSKDAEDYLKFWNVFGPVLKEGVWEDNDHRADLAPLLRFRSSSEEGLTTLPDYITRMKPEQEAIYYLAGDDLDGVAKSPQLEGFRARGIEVLLLADSIDNFWPERLGEFDGKKLRSVTQGHADLDKFTPDETLGEAADVTGLIETIKAALGTDVSDVAATDRLVDSAVVLAAGGGGPDLQMQRLLRRAGRDVTLSSVLQLNPRHPAIRALAARAEKGEELVEQSRLLLDLARLQDGDSPTDPAAFARRVTALLEQG